MNIKFNNIKIHNFMSFEDAELDLNNNGYVLITGVNNYSIDNATSNGSGKTSCIEAISWCLTGETIRGAKSVNRLDCTDGTYVELNFNIDSDEYKLIRSKNSKLYKTNLLIYRNNENVSGKGIRDSEKILSDYLPDLNSLILGSVIILGQGLPTRFTNNSPSGRKEVLEKLSKSDFMIEDIKTRIAARELELKNNISSIDLELLKLNTLISVSNQSIINAQNKLNSLLSEDELNNLKSQLLDNLSKLLNSLSIVNSLITNSGLSELYDKKSNLSSLLSAEINNLRNKYSELSLSNTTRSSEINSLILSLRKEISRLDSIVDVCPTCGQKLIGITKVDTSDLKNLVSSLIEELTIINTNLSNLKTQYNTELTNINNNYNSLLTSINNLITSFTSLQQKLNSLRDLITNLINLTNSRLQVLENEISHLANTKLDLILTIETENLKVLECLAKILYNTNIKEDYSNRLNIITKFSTLIKRDFRGYLLEDIISFIDKKAKEYCKFIFETDLISFLLDGNNISISYNNKEYESLSGGEKLKIDIIIQFAIRDMLCTYLNFSCNILALDEITDNLDSLGCLNIINFISSLLHDVSSIYIISHRKDIDIPYDSLIIVEKDKFGISHVLY